MCGLCNRIEILDEIIDIAKRATDRLSEKLEGYRGKGIPVEMSEEFRHTTLQVIGEAILSLSPEECDRVRVCPFLFPSLHHLPQTHLHLWLCVCVSRLSRPDALKGEPLDRTGETG